MDHPGWGIQSPSCLTPTVPVYSGLLITRPAKYLPRYQTLPDNPVKPVPRDPSSTVVWEQAWMQGKEQTQWRRDRSVCCVNKVTVEGLVDRAACLSCLSMAVFLPQPSGAAFGRALVPRSESVKDSPISRSFPLCCVALTLELCKLFFGCPALAQPTPSSFASPDATLLLSLSSPTLSSTLSQPGDQLLHLRHLIGSFTGFFSHVHCPHGISLDPTARKVKIVGRPGTNFPFTSDRHLPRLFTSTRYVRCLAAHLALVWLLDAITSLSTDVLETDCSIYSSSAKRHHFHTLTIL